MALSGLILLPSLCGFQLSQRELRGKQIYEEGTSPSGKEIIAIANRGETKVPAPLFPCANCHGPDGKGKPEGGVVPSNIQWNELSKPYEITHESGRSHPAYTEQTFKMALLMGLDPARNQLNDAMPRYLLSRDDANDLLAYIQRLGEVLDPGLSPEVIRIGVVLPPKELLPDMHTAVQSALSSYFKDLNTAGGIFGRTIELVFTDLSRHSGDPASGLRKFLEQEPVFGLTSSFLRGAETELANVVEQEQVPLVGAFASTLRLGFPLNRHIFYLEWGLEGQVRALAKFAAEDLSLKDPRVLVVSAANGSQDGIARAFIATCEAAGWGRIQQFVSWPDDHNKTLNRLAAEQPDVLLLLTSGLADPLSRSSFPTEWRPIVLAPASLAARDAFKWPSAVGGRIFLSLPALPVDRSPRSLEHYTRLREAFGLPDRHRSAQIVSLASAATLVQGLRLAGRELSREDLIDALEGLYQFETGWGPTVTFGPNRRVGSSSVYVMEVDRGRRSLSPQVAQIDPR